MSMSVEDKLKRVEDRYDVMRSMVELLMGYVSDEDKGEIIEELLSELGEYRKESRRGMIEELKKGLK